MIDEIVRIAPKMLLVTCRQGFVIYRDQLWAEVTARRESTCIMSDKPIVKGDKIYRPVTHAVNRSWRILSSEIKV